MRAEAILVAAAIDALAGEPGSMHPVRWMGSYLGALRASNAQRRGARPRSGEEANVERGARPWSPKEPNADRGEAWPRSGKDASRARLHGVWSVAAGAVAFGAAGWLTERISERLPGSATVLAQGVLLKPTFAIRALLEAAEQVRVALASGDLPGARTSLGTHLVSRPTAELSADEVAGAAIESLAENLTDSVVAPLLYESAGGLGAAYAYRFLNTADAMLGYRTEELIDFGRFAARADDGLSLIPARLAALLVACSASAGKGSSRAALAAALRDHARTASPNAGWTMAAMAGALGVRLTKRGAYELNAEGRAASADDVSRALRIVRLASVLAVVGAYGLARGMEAR